MKRHRATKPGIRSATIVPTFLLTLGCFGLAALVTLQARPGWWNSDGAVLTPVVVTNSGIVTTNYAPNDYAVANQGQLKQFTVAAVSELNARLTNSGGAGPALSNLVYGWQQDYATNGYATNTANPYRPYKPSDFQAINVGQLKYIASLVYGQLDQAGYAGLYPSWITQNTTTDNSAANLGQLKEVFNFDLTALANAPANLTATTGGPGEIELSWTLPAVNNATSFTVEESTDGGLTWTVAATLTDVTSTSTTLTGLDPGSSYTFALSASNQAGSSTSSGSPPPPVTPKPSPRFAVIDLGSGLTPTSLSSTGKVLLRGTNGYYRWQGGAAQLLAPEGDGILDVDGIDDYGDVVGTCLSVAKSLPCVWLPTSSTPTNLAATDYWNGTGEDINLSSSNCIDYNGRIYGYGQVDALFDIDGNEYPSYDGVTWANFSASPTELGAVYTGNTGTMDDPVYESLGVQKVVGPAKNNHTIMRSQTLAGSSELPTPDSYFVDGVEVPDWPLAINTAGDTILINFPPTIRYSSGSTESITGCYNAYDINQSLLAKHNSDGSVTLVDCPQIIGTNPLQQPTVFQKNPDTNTYQAQKLSDLVSQGSGWSSLTGNLINDSGAIVGTATYTGTNTAIAQGSHGVLLAPAYQIQVDAFIPQEYVTDPVGYVYNGNDRKVPLDGLFTSGTATFTKSSPQFKIEQTAMATVYQELDPNGSQEQNSLTMNVDPTQKYYAAAVVGGHLSPTAAPFATQTAVPDVNTVTITHPASRVVQAEFVGQASNPLANPLAPQIENPNPAWAGPIYYDITVKIDASTTPPTYTLTGNHKLFPAYEVYINGQLVHNYSPIPGGDTPNALIDPSPPSLSDSSITAGTTKPLTGPITP